MFIAHIAIKADHLVELDGYASHRSRHAFERDRKRDRAHARAGHRTIRVTWLQLRDEPDELIADLSALLSGAAASGR